MKANLDNQRWFLSRVADGTLHVPKRGPVKNTVTGTIYNKPNAAGYIQIAMKRDGKKVAILAHRLMWLVHKGWLTEDEQVNHRDGVKSNNRLSNFEKTDNAGNGQHAYDTGLSKWGSDRQKAALLKLKKNDFGENASGAILKEKDVIRIKKMLIRGDMTQEAIGKLFGVARSTIKNIKNGNCWGHLV